MVATYRVPLCVLIKKTMGMSIYDISCNAFSDKRSEL